MKILHLRKLWFAFSIILAIISIFGIVKYGLKTGIDFAGGQIIEARFNGDTSIDNVRHDLSKGEIMQNFSDIEKYPDIKEFPEISVAPTNENTFILRSKELSETQLKAFYETLDNLGEWQEIRSETVGPKVSKDLTKRAFIGVSLALIANILYIAWAFRRVPPPSNSWQFGIAAFISLSFNTLITVGSFAYLGHFFGFEVDALFITAILTIIGYSLNDTIVTFDRIRENLKDSKNESFQKTVENSLEQTIVRSMNTSLVLVLILVSLLVLGGSSLRPFISALLIGAVIGTYSSIFIASQILVVWQNKLKKAK